MQGRPVGQYIPPSDIQPKTKQQQQKKGVELTAPETQVVASGRHAGAADADSAQPITGVLYLATQRTWPLFEVQPA